MQEMIFTKKAGKNITETLISSIKEKEKKLKEQKEESIKKIEKVDKKTLIKIC